VARRPLEEEEVCLDGGRRTTQLMRDSLGGALTHLIRWGKEAFVACTVLWLILTRVEAYANRDLSTPDEILMAASVVMLPFAAVSVWQTASAASRRNWMIMLGLCLLVIAAAWMWHQ